MSKKALITGLSGQDGSYLAELLLAKGYEVAGVVRRVSVPTTNRVNHLLKDLRIIEGDVCDPFCVNEAINDFKPDEVYNLAAQSHVGTSFKQPTVTWNIDAQGVLNFLEAIRLSGRPEEIKFYQASTSEMFGSNMDEDEDGHYQDENTLFHPESPYAIAKVAAHQAVGLYRRAYGIHGSCGILFNHESERRGENFVTRKITKWIGEYWNWLTTDIEPGIPMEFDVDNIIDPNGNKFPKLRLGNLDAYRDWGHAEDYVKAMWLMLQQDEGDDYVVSTGETHSIRDFLDIAFPKVGVEDWSNYVVVDPKFFRPSEVPYLRGKSDKAKQKLNWEPEVKFNELVHRMVHSDKENCK